ncbi:MAG: Asp23/Gls24 family envelope stress response protein [Olsenella uli]|nr:Asp23/Gls24 family envelope stress response protein [Olsenella uli]
MGVESAGADPAGTGLSASAVTDDLADDEDLDSEDSLTFSNGVIEKIVALAMRDVPGVIGMKGSWFNRVQETFGTTDSRKGVTVEVTPEASVRVNISVLIEYGAYAPQVFEDVKRAVVKQVSGMTGLSVAGVNLRIEDVLTAEEAAARNRAAAAADAGGMDPAPTEATDARAASATVAPASAAASAAEKGSALAAEGE